MVKNTLPAVSGGKQFVDIAVILNSEGQKSKLQTYIDEIVRCKQKIMDENESIKGLREAAVEELNIQPKLLNSLVSLYFSNSFDQRREEADQLITAIDALMQTDD